MTFAKFSNCGLLVIQALPDTLEATGLKIEVPDHHLRWGLAVEAH